MLGVASQTYRHKSVSISIRIIVIDIGTSRWEMSGARVYSLGFRKIIAKKSNGDASAVFFN